MNILTLNIFYVSEKKRKGERERERERDELDIRYLCCSLCLDFVSISHFGVDPHLCICAAFD